MRVVCLISGGGTNLQALIDWQTKGLLGDAMIVGVISNVASAYGLERAKRASIPTSVLSHRDYADRLLFDQALRSLIDGYDPDLVVLAGFMRILTAEFVTHYHRRLINIHPSLPTGARCWRHGRRCDSSLGHRGVGCWRHHSASRSTHRC